MLERMGSMAPPLDIACGQSEPCRTIEAGERKETKKPEDFSRAHIGGPICAADGTLQKVAGHWHSIILARAIEKTRIAVLRASRSILLIEGCSRRSEERRVGKEGRSRWSPYH